MKFRFCVVFIISLLFARIGHTQDSNRALVVRMDGFIIDFGGEIIFQPCEDTSADIFGSFDRRSFSIWCNQFTSKHCESIAGLGDSMLVKYASASDTTIRYRDMRYFYCSIKISLFIIGNDHHDFNVFDKPKYQIINDGKMYPLNCFYIRGNLMELIPRDKALLRRIYDFYDKNGYTSPDWLQRSISH